MFVWFFNTMSASLGIFMSKISKKKKAQRAIQLILIQIMFFFFIMPYLESSVYVWGHQNGL